MILRVFVVIENILSDASSDDYERYSKTGLKLEPNNPYFLRRKGLKPRQRIIK